MALSPIAFIAPNYTKFKTNWLKAYEPGTTTPKSMALDPAGAVTVAKLQLNADGFLVSAGQALVIPYINGAYDLWLFPTEAEADANDTSNAERLADNITGVSSTSVSNDLINDLSQAYEFATVAAFKASLIEFPDGKTIRLLDRGADFTKITGTGTANTLDIIASTGVNQSIQLVYSPTANVMKYGAIGDGVTDDSPAILRAVNVAKEIFFPRPPVFFRMASTVLLRNSQKLFCVEPWLDWFLAADQAKCIQPDSGVAAFTTIAAGRSYPNNAPTSLEFVRGLTFESLHIRTVNAPCVIHHYSTNFKYDGCVLRANNSPALPMRQAYRGNINNCFISVDNYAGYAVQLYDNCNGISFTGFHYSTNGTIAGAVDISKSQVVTFDGVGIYEINGLPCIRVGGLTALEAEFPEERGNCNGISIKGRYFERCKEPIQIGVDAPCLGTVIEGNSVFSYDDSDNYISCVTLGASSGTVVQGNSWQKMGAVDFPTLLLAQVVGSPFRVPLKVTWQSNHTQRADLSSGTNFAFDASLPSGLAGYVFGSGKFDFTNSKDIGDGIPIDFKTYGERSEHLSPVTTSTDATVVRQYGVTKEGGGLIEKIELVNVTGSIDGTLRIGESTSSGVNLIFDLSTASVVNGYELLVAGSQLIAPSKLLVVQHVQGALTGTYQVKITYRI